jgi:arylformamidase
MAKIHDISQPLHAALPVWPGEPAVSVERRASIGPDCPVNVGALHMSLHAGTHADAPFHYDALGTDSASSGLDPYIGPCIVLDVRGAGTQIEPEDIDWAAVTGARRVLLRTYDCFPHNRWKTDFKPVAPATVSRLAANGVRLIGTDTPSLDPETSKTMDAHKAVRTADMRILEGLVLDDIVAGRYELIALPLAIAGADASPVRAILRDLA